MNRLSETAQNVLAGALAARRVELQRRVKFWAAQPGTQDAPGEGNSPFAETAAARLSEVEAVIQELDKRAIPWLHCHPDCSDLFTTKQSAAAAVKQSHGDQKLSYEVTPRDAAVGGGWRLRLFQDGQEVGGGTFPAPEGPEEQEAYFEATGEGEEWLLSQALRATAATEAA